MQKKMLAAAALLLTLSVAVPAAGGSYTILAGGLDKAASKYPLGWVGNDPAP